MFVDVFFAAAAACLKPFNIMNIFVQIFFFFLQFDTQTERARNERHLLLLLVGSERDRYRTLS